MKNSRLKITFSIIIFLFILLGFSTSYATSLTILGLNTMKVNEQVQLNSVYNSSEDGNVGMENDVSSMSTWSSSDSSIATVDNEGKVTAIKAGSTIIKAEYTPAESSVGKLSAEFELTVIEADNPNPDPDPNPPSEPEWTDVSNVSFSIERKGTEFFSYYLTLSGLSRKENHEYFAFVTNTPTLPADILANPYESNEKSFISTDTSILINNNIENNGDIYVWIYERIYNMSSNSFECNARISAKKVERPAHLSLGLRMQTYFFNEYTSLFVKEFPVSEGRKYHIKIGNITNLEILRAIRDEKSGSFTSLLNYAKSATSPLYDDSFTYSNSGTNYPAVSNNLPIVDDGFYYVYMYLEDEGGKYYPLEDIGLYQALVGDTVGKNLTDYFTNKDKFNWDALGSETPDTPSPTPTPNPSDPTASKTPIPDTGKEVFLFGFTLIFSTGIFAYIKYQKYKEIN